MTTPPGRQFQLLARFLACPIAALLLGQVLYGCNYARMRDDEAHQTYQSAMPQMPDHLIPVTGGDEVLRTANADDLKNPLPPGTSVAVGKERYGYYCVHCHGPRGEGYGTVGQSFAPLPTNLRSSDVQDQTDGALFYSISFGIARHPPLAETIAIEHRWAIVNYVRAMAQERQ
jgi:mono/diheme cytochrome c family protein